MRYIAIVIAVIALTVSLFQDPPACAQRMAAQGLTGVCFGK